MNKDFAVSILRAGDDHVVSVRDLPEVVTAGGTLEEALALAADAIEVAVVKRMERDEELPRPSRLRKGEHAVALPTQLAAKAAVYAAWKAAGISKSELGRRMKRSEVEARRILAPRHGTKLDQLDEAARALGRRLVIGVEPLPGASAAA